MSDITAITNKITAKAKEEAQAIIDRANAASEELIKKSKEETEQKEQAEKERLETAAKNKYEQRVTKAKAAGRNKLLFTKHEILSEVFEEALNKMKRFSKEEFLNFAQGCLKSGSGKGEVVFGEKVKGFAGEKWLSEFNKASGSSYTLSKDTIPGEYGFIIRSAGVETNFIFSEIVRFLQGELMPLVNDRLFG